MSLYPVSNRCQLHCSVIGIPRYHSLTRTRTRTHTYAGALGLNGETEYPGQGTDTAAVIDLATGAQRWNISLGPAQYEPYGQSGWSIIGPPSSQTLLRVSRKNATAIDIATGKPLWSSTDLAGYGLEGYGKPAAWPYSVVLSTLDGGDGNSNTLVAVSLEDGTTLWQFPPKGSQGTNGMEAFIDAWQCSFDPQPPNVSVAAPAPQASAPAGVCFLEYSCQKTSTSPSEVGGIGCPAPLRIPNAPMCGAEFGAQCRPVLDLQTGKGLYTLTAASGLPVETGGSTTPPFRVGDSVLFDGTSKPEGKQGLVSLNARKGTVDWVLPCAGCAEGLLAVTTAAEGCTATLKVCSVSIPLVFEFTLVVFEQPRLLGYRLH